jgi:hypothetical protein
MPILYHLVGKYHKRGVGHMNNFDSSRARLNKKDMFQRFTVKSSESLDKAVEQKKINQDDLILILERNDCRLAFSVFQMAYHHIAQGELKGDPYLVTF